MKTRPALGTTLLAIGLLAAACDDSAKHAADSAAVTTTDAADTTSAADTSEAAETQAATDSTAIEVLDDTNAGEITAETSAEISGETTEEVTPTTCGCGGGSDCLQAKTSDACALIAGTCGAGGMHRVDACDAADVEASCEHATTIHYLYWARIEGWLQNLKDSCDSTAAGPAGTFVVAEIPEGVGAPCSCQRTAAACVETYGDACAALTCDAPEGKQATLCPSASRLPGRCVTRDGQRELVFYTPAANLQNAEMSCNGASATEYYWIPDGL